MQLRYRGIAYESNPVQIEMVETKLTASFRGLSYPVRRCINLYIPQTIRLSLLKAAAGTSSGGTLRYRGVEYIKGQADTATLPTKQQLTINPAIGYVYRGVPWERRSLKPALAPSAIARLKYRGVSYFHIIWGTPPQKPAASTRVPVGKP